MSPPSPVLRPAEEVVVIVDSALSGNELGRLKVTAATTLSDIRVAVLTAMGGGYRKHEVHLFDPQDDLHEKAFGKPFSQARDGDHYRAILVALDDCVYLDLTDDSHSRRQRRAR